MSAGNLKNVASLVAEEWSSALPEWIRGAFIARYAEVIAIRFPTLRVWEWPPCEDVYGDMIEDLKTATF